MWVSTVVGSIAPTQPPTHTIPKQHAQHFNFTPEVSFVKRVVEGLIETEYLRRTPERRDWVDYVA